MIIINYIKSPLNYTGNKFKLLSQILPLFPQNINTFVDSFGGSGTVSANINANKIIYNEISKPIEKLVEWISTCNADKEVISVRNKIKEFGLYKNGKEEYYSFRNEYNKNPSSILLFVLTCFSLNYNFRFNSKGEFNMTCGNRDFSKDMEYRFLQFNSTMKNKNVLYLNGSYKNITNLSKNDFVYLDPPYLPTIASYTENSAWSPDKEIEMYTYIDWLNNNNIKFALSNVSVYRGIKNEILFNWMNKYNVHNLDFKYINNNCHRKDNTTFTQEVLITNY